MHLPHEQTTCADRMAQSDSRVDPLFSLGQFIEFEGGSGMHQENLQEVQIYV